MFRRKKKDKKNKNAYPGEQAYLSEWDSKPVDSNVQEGKPPGDVWQPTPDQWPKEKAKPVTKSVWQPPPENWPSDVVPSYTDERLPPMNPEYISQFEQPPPPPYEEAMKQQQQQLPNYPQMYPQLQPQRPIVQQASPAYVPYHQSQTSAVQMTIDQPKEIAKKPSKPAVQYPPPPPDNSMYDDE